MMVLTADTGIQIQLVLAVRVYNVYKNTIYSIPPIMTRIAYSTRKHFGSWASGA